MRTGDIFTNILATNGAVVNYDKYKDEDAPPATNRFRKAFFESLSCIHAFPVNILVDSFLSLLVNDIVRVIGMEFRGRTLKPTTSDVMYWSKETFLGDYFPKSFWLLFLIRKPATTLFTN